MASVETSTHTCMRKKCYQCPECLKCFASPAHLKIHERVHSGERPFGCETCLKKFSQKATLDQHKLIHSGVKDD